MRRVARKLRESLAGAGPGGGQGEPSGRFIPILPLLGNNEGYPNYNLSLESFDGQLRDLYDIYREEGLDVPEEFMEAGRYSYVLEFAGSGGTESARGQPDLETPGDAPPGPKPPAMTEKTDTGSGGGPLKVRIVALNTLYYSVRYQRIEETGEDPLGQLEWLSEELGRAREEKTPVIVAAHLPPGVNGFTGAENLVDRFSRSLARVLGENTDVVAAAFYGHYHHEQMKLYDAMRWSSAPALVCPSISPNSYNNPGFLIAEFSWRPAAGGTVASQLRFEDYWHYSADLEESNMYGNVTFRLAYRFSDAYAPALRAPGGVTGLNVRSLLFRTVTDRGMMREYTNNAKSGHAADRRRNTCAIRSPNRRLYHECLEDFSWG